MFVSERERLLRVIAMEMGVGMMTDSFSLTGKRFLCGPSYESRYSLPPPLHTILPSHSKKLV